MMEKMALVWIKRQEKISSIWTWPPGFASVPVKVDDNGYEDMARMLAGLAGLRCSKSQALEQSGEEGEDTLQPEVGWWIFRVMDDDKSDDEIIRRDSSRMPERRR